jgi:type 1 glutamine amidotransferase
VVQPNELGWFKKYDPIKVLKFRHHEEWYAHRNFSDDLRVLLVQETAGMNTSGRDRHYNRPPFPCCWARMEQKGRVAYTALGHNSSLFDSEMFKEHCAGLINWIVGNVDMDMTPNMDIVTPGARILQNPR